MSDDLTAPYRRSGDVVSVQRCAHGDDERGYCAQPAVVHLWVDVPGLAEGATSMACPRHRGDVEWTIRDQHPVDGPCGLPGTTWRHSHPVGGPGWCELDGIDWLAAVEQAATAP